MIGQYKLSIYCWVCSGRMDHRSKEPDHICESRSCREAEKKGGGKAISEEDKDQISTRLSRPHAVVWVGGVLMHMHG